MLPVRIAQRFAGRRFRSERLAGKAVGDHAQRVDAKDLAFGVKLCEALAHDRVADAATLLNQVHEVARRGTPAPLRAFAREGDTFVGQGVLRELPAAVLFADEVLSGETNVGEEDLVEQMHAGHLDDRRHFDAGQIHRHDEVAQACVLRRVGVRARQQDPELRRVRERRPDLLTVDDVLVAFLERARRDVGEVAAGLGLAEELAPDLVGRKHRHDVAVLLLVGAVLHEDRAAVADADRVDGTLDLRALQLVVDEQLRHRVGVEPPRLRPVGDDVACLREVFAAGFGVLGQPGAHLEPSRVVFRGKLEVHEAATIRLPPKILQQVLLRVTVALWRVPRAGWPYVEQPRETRPGTGARRTKVR